MNRNLSKEKRYSKWKEHSYKKSAEKSMWKWKKKLAGYETDVIY